MAARLTHIYGEALVENVPVTGFARITHFYAEALVRAPQVFNIEIETDLTLTPSMPDNFDEQLVTSLALNQSFDIQQTVFNVTVETVLSLEQSIFNQINEEVTTELELEATVQRQFNEEVTTTLELEQAFVLELHWMLTTELTLTATPTAQLTLNPELTTELALYQTITLDHVTDNTFCTFDPVIGFSDDPLAPNPPAGIAPTLTPDVLTLTYPYNTPTDTLELRNPIFRDRDRLEFARVHRALRGGHVVIYADTSWPRQQVLSFEVVGIDIGTAYDFLDFIALSLGAEVGLLDHEGRQWRGIITTPMAEITDQSPGVCRYDLTFEFEGELV